MATKTANSKTSLTATVNNIPDYQKAVSEIDQYLSKKQPRTTNENVMLALHNLLNDGAPFLREQVYHEFIVNLRCFFLIPGMSEQFIKLGEYSPKSLNYELSMLETFFAALDRPEIQAEVLRFGLQTNPERYNKPEWDDFDNLTKPFREA